MQGRGPVWAPRPLAAAPAPVRPRAPRHQRQLRRIRDPRAGQDRGRPGEGGSALRLNLMTNLNLTPSSNICNQYLTAACVKDPGGQDPAAGETKVHLLCGEEDQAAAGFGAPEVPRLPRRAQARPSSQQEVVKEAGHQF